MYYCDYNLGGRAFFIQGKKEVNQIEGKPFAFSWGVRLGHPGREN